MRCHGTHCNDTVSIARCPPAYDGVSANVVRGMTMNVLSGHYLALRVDGMLAFRIECP